MGRAKPPATAAMARHTSRKECDMPKLKTKSGAKKRFTRTATGKIKMAAAHKRHRLISKPQQMKRKARGTRVMDKCDEGIVRKYMPYL